MSAELVPVPRAGTAAVPDAQGAADQRLRDIAESVALLSALPPPDPTDRYNPRSLTTLWLNEKSKSSTRGYFLILADWLAWCERRALDPLTARKADTDAWKKQMTARKLGRGGVETFEPAARATVAKRLAVVTSWYDYLIKNERDIRNPARATDRPSVPRTSTTESLSLDEMVSFLDYLVARAERLGTESAWRDAALLTMLFVLGLRVTSGCTTRLENLRVVRGHRVLRYLRKSRGDEDEWGQEPLPPVLSRVLDRYLAVRVERESREQGRQLEVRDLTGYIFVSTPHPYLPQYTGGQPLGQNDVWDTMRNLARQAGIASWEQISPHVARHTAVTVLLDEGADVTRVQHLVDHANVETTMRYVHGRDDIDKSAVWQLSDAISRVRNERAAAGQHVADPAPRPSPTAPTGSV